MDVRRELEDGQRRHARADQRQKPPVELRNPAHDQVAPGGHPPYGVGVGALRDHQHAWPTHGHVRVVRQLYWPSIRRSRRRGALAERAFVAVTMTPRKSRVFGCHEVGLAVAPSIAGHSPPASQRTHWYSTRWAPCRPVPGSASASARPGPSRRRSARSRDGPRPPTTAVSAESARPPAFVAVTVAFSVAPTSSAVSV